MDTIVYFRAFDRDVVETFKDEVLTEELVRKRIEKVVVTAILKRIVIKDGETVISDITYHNPRYTKRIP